jgi:ABC-type nickel/cobalt efflux system permease component RcnA
VNILGKAVVLDLSIGLAIALVGIVAPEAKKRAERRARETLADVSPELAEQLEELEQAQ